MEKWTTITRDGHPKVKGISPNGRAEIIVTLSGMPPPEWARLFLETYSAWNVRSPDDDWPLPEIRGSSVVSWPMEADLKRWVQLMDERIAHANSAYEKVLPDKARREAEAREAAQNEKDRLDQLQAEADQL